MKRDSFPALTIIVLIFGMAAFNHSTIQPREMNACFWDRDTLAFEASGYPGITEIITGRFDRFPPLYYEMRLERVATEIESGSSNLDLYDDAGVACDRLGRHDKAIEWMARKRLVLDRLANNPEQEYRYLANLGTMHIHRWLNNGANQDDLSDVERSHELIAAAIELNPDAHFGRERYQLLTIKWILDGYLHDEDEWHQPSIVESMEGYRENSGIFVFDDIGYDDAVDGFSGLIALGNAWESIDIFYALSMALKDQEHTSVYLLCQLRIKELIDSGKTSLSHEFDHAAYQSDNTYDNYPIYASLTPYPLDNISDNYYPKARKEADERAVRRQDYMQDRLMRGEHPDTHKSFWADWSETTSPPTYPSPYGSFVVMAIASIVVIVLFLFLVRRAFKHHSQAAAKI